MDGSQCIVTTIAEGTQANAELPSLRDELPSLRDETMSDSDNKPKTAVAEPAQREPIRRAKDRPKAADQTDPRERKTKRGRNKPAAPGEVRTHRFVDRDGAIRETPIRFVARKKTED